MSAENFKRRTEERKTREKKLIEERQTKWLIVCEGEKTEPNYFKGLESFLKEKSGKIDIVARGKGRNTEDLVKNIEEYFDFIDKELGKSRIPFEKIILVYDKDDFGDGQFNNSIKMAEARIEKPIVAWSNESFELWLCLHFDICDAPLNRNQYNDKLTEIFRKKGIYTKKQKYENHGKNDSDIFNTIIKAGGSLTQAINNSKKLLEDKALNSPAKANPATLVGLATQALINDSGLDLKEIK